MRTGACVLMLAAAAAVWGQEKGFARFPIPAM